MIRTRLHTVLIILIFSACTIEQEKVPLAQVGTKMLYLDEVEKVLPEDLPPADSALWMDDFIQKWVQRELMVLNAEENLSISQKDVSRELEEYRNSLITYRYKKALMEQKMDTLISDQAIEAYYDAHKNEFILKNDIVKAVYLKTPLELANPETLKELSMDNDPQKLLELDEYGIRYAKNYDRFDDKWIDASRILTQIPTEIDNLERFLRRNKFIESDDTEYYYFICIRDFRFEGEHAPVDFVKSSIKNILLNQRKINFLKKIETDVYQEGLESNKFKLYTIKK
ncbi:hypothetical protein [Sunxiuqinia sp. sy24]|uniref:hypothetical protein n=1 Tax=Sunxiuqinia sp. sy24 TaxID=3461495 RepID=UPI0040463FCF